MSSQSLVKMANDIGRFFAAEPKHADAVAGIAAHMQRFWDPRMLRKITAYVREGGTGLDELSREAVLSLKLPDSTSGSPADLAARAEAGGAGH